MKDIKVLSDESQINICLTDTGAYINGGEIGSLKIGRSPITTLKIKRLSDNREFLISSESNFKKTKVIRYKEYTQLALINPLDGEAVDFMLLINVRPNKTNIEWEISVINDNPGYSVMSISYPVLRIIGDVNAFLPKISGVVEKNIIENGFSDREVYPRGEAYSMQYFAFYNEIGGIYAATHDATGSLKNIIINTYKEENSCELIIDFPAINMGKGANSFALPGKMVWQTLHGDWYDASNIYREFVLNNAEWIPEIDENGRTDTPEWFKNLPFWIMDWVPNLEGKDDELPTNVKPLDGSEIKEDDWVENAIKLQKELDVPIGYHIYNWHKIPFNNDYPHFFPEQRGVKEGIQKLKENNIYAMPYVNALLWDTLDRGNEDYMYESVAKKWTIKLENGKVSTQSYESYEKDGRKCILAAMCPSSGVWRTQISGVVSKAFDYLGANALYLDQIAAHDPEPCCDKEHNHPPGGGNWWIKSYNDMLMRYRVEKNENCAITSESNAETYLKGLDGYLTWIWLQSNSVPAFSRVYAGYAVFFGRNSDGKMKSNIMFYKHSIAQALLYGQQLGWINADIVKNKEKMPFLKKMVSLRYRYTRFFNCGELLRPPKTECDIEDIETEPPMWFSGPQIIRPALSGIWRLNDKSRTVLFVINISKKSAKITLTCDKYGQDVVLKEGDANIISVENTDEKTVINILAEPESYAVIDII